MIIDRLPGGKNDFTAFIRYNRAGCTGATATIAVEHTLILTAGAYRTQATQMAMSW